MEVEILIENGLGGICFWRIKIYSSIEKIRLYKRSIFNIFFLSQLSVVQSRSHTNYDLCSLFVLVFFLTKYTIISKAQISLSVILCFCFDFLASFIFKRRVQHDDYSNCVSMSVFCIVFLFSKNVCKKTKFANPISVCQ